MADARVEQKIGSVLPDVALPLVAPAGGAWRLHDVAKQHRGVMLIFWSSVCSHCNRYDDYLNTFAARHPGVALTGIASRQGEAVDDVRKAMEARGLTFPMLYDAGSLIANQLFTQQTPRVFLVDAAATLRYRGAIDNFKYPEDHEFEPYLEPAVESMLAGSAIARPETPSFGCAINSVYYTIPKPLGKRLL
ncbi:MAG TPA: redoxin domain-containing protein [Vicinamibacterales bacterium]|jgi:peroxiredoxin|nr:redoxin domain-containing protein [Vicinamibacterales bacterium]